MAHVGRATSESRLELRNVIAFFGSFIAAAAGVIRRPRSGNLRDIIRSSKKAGATRCHRPVDQLPGRLRDGLPVGAPAASYGANIFVADIVGLAVRRARPLMTAIIVCGRSGAAIAAELGTMKCRRDRRLSSLGLGPMRYLVFPRVLAW